MIARKIIKIEKVGIKPTVDIEVRSNNHLFFGNGIATSNSHAVSYAINAYLSAYTKAHFPRAFFSSYLKFAKNKINPQDEIKALVQNAREMNIDVVCPDIRKLNEEFILNEGKIYFGLTDIKSVGKSVFNKMQKILSESKKSIEEFTWLDLLFILLININSSAAKALIESNACSFIKKNRTEMLFELDIALSLTNKEQKFILTTLENKKDLNECLTHLIQNGKVNKNRQKIILDHIQMIKNPPYSLIDSPDWIVDVEDANLGCSITCSKIDMYDISMTNTCCKNFKNFVTNNNIIIGGEIESINIIKTKKGKSPGELMAFVSISDSTGVLDSIIFFPEVFKKYKQILFEGSIIIVSGKKTKSNDGLIVEKAYIAKT
jgi:DNA polymerase-3 subunit alpha